MFSNTEILILNELVTFADDKGVNKSEISRKVKRCTKTVRNVIKKIKEAKENVGK